MPPMLRERQRRPYGSTPAPSPRPKVTHVKATDEFTLVSSDGVRFRIPAHHLLSASEVFRDAADIATDDRCIEFTDEVIETSSVLRMFWSLMVEAKLGPTFKPYTALEDYQTCLESLIPLLRFLQKWEMRNLLNATTAYLCKLVSTKKLSPFCCLIAGAIADDIETCVVAITQSNFELPSSDHVSSIPYDLWKEIPQRFAWAFAHSSNYHTGYNVDRFCMLVALSGNPDLSKASMSKKRKATVVTPTARAAVRARYRHFAVRNQLPFL